MFWIVVAMIATIIALIVASQGCCASTCETVLAECERGLAEELHQQVESMCACGVPDYDDGGCALAAAGGTP